MKWNSAVVAACSLILGVTGGLMLNPVLTSDGTPHVALWLEILNRICSSIASMGTLVALIFVARQFELMRSQSELLHKNVVASMDSVLYNRLDSFNRFIVEHHEIYDLLNTLVNGQESKEQRATLHRLCDLGFSFYEEAFKHNSRYKLQHSEDWEQWKANFQHFFAKSYVRGYWQTVSIRYSRSFQNFVDDVVHTSVLKVAA